VARRSIVVVGSGFSGTHTALHLLTESDQTAIQLVEKGPRFARGAAYSTADPDHLLNVRACNMSAYPEAGDHFLDWLARRDGAPRADPFTFAPRGVYGAYLQDQLRGALQSGAAANRLTLVQDEVIGISPDGGGFAVRLAMGRQVLADRVVVATGNGAPGPVTALRPEVAASDAYAANPWAPGALDAVKPADRVLLLGAGLSMVDVVASLDARGHQGAVIALSRRGLLPLAHARGHGQVQTAAARPGEALSLALRRLRRAAGRASDWRQVFDGLRGATPGLWKAMDETNRARFLRHLRPYWEIHRHRMAPRLAERIAGHLASGRLTVVAGRLETVAAAPEGLAATWRPRGERASRTLTVDRVINCTGPEGDPRRSDQPLIRDLLDQGLARPDTLGLGLDVDEDGRLLAAHGGVVPGLFAIGPIGRGALWEVTAVPDIRVQAWRLATLLRAEG
jgi:uncharacterized NAD(P)/FAD-binding protein YdhS